MKFWTTKTKHWQTTLTVVEDHEAEVIDYHETFQYWLPKVIVVAVSGLGIYLTHSVYFLLIPLGVGLAIAIDWAIGRWGKWIRIGKWLLILFYTIPQYPRNKGI